MPNLVIMQGLPGSGKTQIAMQYVEQGYQLVQEDCLRYAFGVDKNWQGWSEELEDKVKSAIDLQLNGMMQLGLDAVVDETNTLMEKFDVFKALANRFNYTLYIHRVDTPVETCKQRRLPNGFPEHVIDRIHGNMNTFKQVIDPVLHEYDTIIKVSGSGCHGGREDVSAA